MGGGEKRSANGVSRKYSCRTEGADPSWANAVIMLMAKDRLKRPAVVNLRRPQVFFSMPQTTAAKVRIASPQRAPSTSGIALFF